MSELRNKITSRLDEIEDLMNINMHVTHPQDILERVSNVSKFWSVLSDEDKDFIEAVKWATEEKAIWKDD